MLGTTHIDRLGAALAVVAAAAALAAPAALAGGNDTGGQAGDTYYRLDPWLKTAIDAHGAQRLQSTHVVPISADRGPYRLDPWLRTAIAAHRRHVRLSAQPAPGAPLPRQFQHQDSIFRGLDETDRPVASAQASGFDWSSFGIGIGTGVGALLILGAVASRVGRVRRPVSA